MDLYIRNMALRLVLFCVINFLIFVYIKGFILIAHSLTILLTLYRYSNPSPHACLLYSNIMCLIRDDIMEGRVPKDRVGSSTQNILVVRDS